MNKREFSIKLTKKILFMTEEDVIDIDKKGHTIGLHSFSHPTQMNKLSIDKQEIEYQKNYSHLSEIKIKKAEFLDFLKSNKFKLTSNSNIYLKVDNDVYSSDEIFDIYDLYNFKRECFQNELISPFPNDSKKNNENILSFTPIKIEEFYKENYLFPPKSTWITPRI